MDLPLQEDTGMISLKNPLRKMASVQPADSFFRSVFANMAREAGIQEDLFARASYIEGLLGAKPGSISKTPRASLQKVSDALASGEEHHLISMLRTDYRMADQDIEALVGLRDFDLFGALVQGATKAMPRGSARGLTPQDVAMSIASGLSPLTLKPLRYGPGKNVFYHLGEKAHGKITIGGILAILREEAKNRAIDLVRGTNKGEATSESLEAPIGNGEDSSATLADFLADTSNVSQNIELVYGIFKDRAVLSLVDREIRQQLTATQAVVWAAIARNPLLIDIEGSKLGVDNRGLAAAISEMTGVPNTRSLEVSAGKIFRERVWPAFEDVVGNSAVTAPLLRNQDIQQLILESTRGQPYMASSRAQADNWNRKAFVRERAKILAARVLRTK